MAVKSLPGGLSVLVIVVCFVRLFGNKKMCVAHEQNDLSCVWSQKA